MTARLSGLSLLLLLSGVSGVRVQSANQHPRVVLSGKASDAEICLSCHKQVKGKHTHTAVKEMGCLGCHDVQTEDEKTTVTLVESGNALCFVCHADKDVARIQGRVHGPVAEGECVACHNPHASENQFQLLQPLSGGKDENLCLMCHDIGESVPEKGSRHPALDLGCDSCHATHKSGPPETPEYFHLVQSAPELCLTCHDATDKQITAAHAGQPFARANCLGCHNPHASEQPKLNHANSHPPFTERQCDVCHETPREGKVVLTEGGKRALCFLCHDTLLAQVTSAKVVHGVFAKEDTCTNCHSPHATPYTVHLKKPIVALCESCHPQVAQDLAAKKFVHPPVFEVGCTACHDPHASNFTARLRAATNDTCLACHGSQVRSALQTGGPIRLFEGAVQLDPGALTGIRLIPLQSGENRGHPIAGHPVRGEYPLTGKTEISCVTCHNPHASDSTKRMFQLKVGIKTLCLNCHA